MGLICPPPLEWSTYRAKLKLSGDRSQLSPNDSKNDLLPCWDVPYRGNWGQGYLKDIICPLTEIGLMYLTKLMFSFIPFLVFGFWSLLATKVQKYKYHVIFVYILQGRMGKTENKRKENHATEVIKKTKKRKYGMNKTFVWTNPIYILQRN